MRTITGHAVLAPEGAATAADASIPSNMNRVGYARISTYAKSNSSQMEALAAARCHEIVEETTSTRKDRPKLRKTVAAMKAGDTLIIYKPDQVAHSVKQLLEFLEDELAPRGINLQILSGVCAGLHRPNGQSAADKMLFLVAAMAAEMQRDLISERTLEGLAAAAAHGRKGGRPNLITNDVLEEARVRRARGDSVTMIAKRLGVGRSTLYRALEADEPQTDRPEEPVEQSPPQDFTVTADQNQKCRDVVPWTSDADPIHRPHWYTAAELQSLQLAATEAEVFEVRVAGELLGFVRPHYSATGNRSGWEARRPNGAMAWHVRGGVRGGGSRPATRQAAVADLIADVQYAWKNMREHPALDIGRQANPDAADD